MSCVEAILSQVFCKRQPKGNPASWVFPYFESNPPRSVGRSVSKLQFCSCRDHHALLWGVYWARVAGGYVATGNFRFSACNIGSKWGDGSVDNTRSPSGVERQHCVSTPSRMYSLGIPTMSQPQPYACLAVPSLVPLSIFHESLTWTCACG